MMLDYKDNTLHFDGVSIKKIADTLETPFFLISEQRIQENYYSLKQGLSGSTSSVKIRYCAKTNNEAGILKILADCGSDVMTSNLEETELALGTGFTPQKIAYQRPVLEKKEIIELLKKGVTFFHAYRLEDLNLLEECARKSSEEILVSLRLRNETPISAISPLNIVSRRLGFKSSDIPIAVARLSASSWLKLSAINFYRGTQQFKPASYKHLIQKSIKLAGTIHSSFNISIDEINLGGGIPSPSLNTFNDRFRKDDQIRHLERLNSINCLQNFGHNLSKQYFDTSQLLRTNKVPVLVVEPGRSIVGNAGVLITRVKALQGKWAFVDASRNYLGENPLLFTRTILSINRDHYDHIYHLSGKTLNTLDVLDYWRYLPLLKVSDLLVFCDAGAYSISRANRYAGMLPAVYLLRTNKTLKQIRHKEGYFELSKPMIF